MAAVKHKELIESQPEDATYEESFASLRLSVWWIVVLRILGQAM